MKKEATQKSKLWLWLLIGAVALAAIAGVVLALVLGGGGEETDGPKGGRAELYWNVDKAFYTENSESGLSTREPGADGVYTVRYAHDGQLLELPVADKQLINYIDTMDCMGIVQDADGVVIDVVDPKTLATETARMFYVRKVENGVITLNSSLAMNGMSMDVPVVDVTEIYDVTDRPEQIGQKVTAESLESMDAITVYSNDKNEATHIYVVSHPVESPVYWRADTGFYSSANKQTTRTPDAEGYYTIPFYVDGEYVELKCNIQGIVNTIDAKNRFKAHTGLVLDEEGRIVDNMLAATGIRGLLGCEMYDVIEVDGKTFTAEAQIANSGDTYTNTLTDDAKIYNVSMAAKPEVRGKAVDSLQIGDRVVVFENADGEAMLVFVAHRLVDSPMYFNMTKKYNSTLKETTRVPDGDGWYTIEMFSEGVIKTYKTKDKALVTYIDSQNNRGVGLELDGDVITYAWPGECVAGYSALVGYSVQNVTGSIISMTPPNNPESISNRILHPNCKVYNMSGVKQKKGELTELLPEDYCIFWRNAKSELVYVYVIRRKVEAPIYFSLTRKWDSTTQQSTRQPVDGWYVYECASEGKHVTVKTRSKEAADFLDSQSPQSFALKVDSNGVIYEYYETTNVTGGSKSYLNTDVKKISGKELTLYNATNGKTYTPKMADDCKVYNVSGVYEKLRGEKSSVQVTDRIQCYTNIKGEIVLIYIRIRNVDADVYFSKNRIKELTADGKTARQPDAEGWYVFQCAFKGEEVTVKTKDLDVATLMDAQSPQAFALKVDKNGIIQKAYPATAAVGGSTRAVNAVVKSVDGDKIVVKLTNGDDFEMPMASSYEVYNVTYSDAIDDHWGEKTTIRVGDTLQSYTNKENKVCLVYVRYRPDDVKLYWNFDKQYDSANKMSTRTPAADGYFHVELAIDGEIKEFLVKEQSVINYIDSANGAVACTLKEGVITKAQSAIYGKGVWSSVDAAVIATVQEVKENALVIKDGKNEIREIPLAADCIIRDVTSKANFANLAVTPKVGDYGRIYLNLDKQAVYFFIMKHATAPESSEPVRLYWNLHRNTDPVADADGYYHFEMAVGGQIKNFKTKEVNAANYADGANGAVALTLSASDPTVFTNAQSALYADGVDAVGPNGANSGAVTQITDTYAVLGADTILLLADSAEIIDVSGTGAFIGEATTLKVGDSISRSYVDENGYALYIFIGARTAVDTPDVEIPVYDNSNLQLDADNKAKCPYCDEEVVWTALEAISSQSSVTLEDGVHYYLAADIEGNQSYYNIAKDTEICVHLNGKNISSSNRVFAVSADGNLNVMGNGTVTGAYTGTATANVAAATISCRGNMNLIGGTYKHVDSTLPTIIMSRPQRTLSIYEGVKIEGTEGITGTNLYIMYGVVDMYGGTISGGTVTPDGTTMGKGDNIYLYGLAGTTPARAEFNMYGGTVDGGIYAENNSTTYKLSVSGDAVITENKGGLTLDTETAAKLTVGDLGENAKIYVTGSGEVTNAYAAAATDVNTKILPASANVTLKAEGDVIIATVEGGTEPEPQPEPVWVLAWVVEPEFDSTNTVTTRTPDAEGYYYVELSVDGVTKTYKTKATGLGGAGNGIDYVDQSGFKNRAIAICLTDKDSLEFTIALGATNNTGATGAKVTTVTAIEGGVITGTGDTYTGKMAADGKVFDVSSSATVEGEISELRVGDYARFYTNPDGDVLYAYVYTRTQAPEPTDPTEPEGSEPTEPTEPSEPPATVDMNEVFTKANEMTDVFAQGGEVEAECPACAATVTWKPMEAVTTSSKKIASGHYYLAADSEGMSSYYNITDGVEICLHLNGKTLECDDERVFYVDKTSKLTVMGSGNVIGGRSAKAGVQRCGNALEIVGKGTVVNLCGGTWSKSKNDLDVMGVRGYTGCTLSIYDGTVINGTEGIEGYELLIASGIVNLAGGEINGDVYLRDWLAASTDYPYAISVAASGTAVNGTVLIDEAIANDFNFVLSGDVKIGELIPGKAVNVGRLVAGADVKVTAEGAFTNANPNMQDYVDAAFLSAKEEGKIVSVTDGVASIADATAEETYDNSDLNFETGTTRAMCTWCGEVKDWIALESTADGATDGLTVDGGHYYLASDLLENKGRYNVGEITVCVHLNGHSVTNLSNRVFTIGTKGTLTIMGNGVVTGNNNATTTANVAAATISVRKNLNLVGGTYKTGEASTLPAILMAKADGKLDIYEGANVDSNLTVAYGHMVLNGGTIKELNVLGADIGGTHAQTSATLLGGTVEKAFLDARDPNGQYATWPLDMIVGGDVKIANAELASGAKLTLDELKAGAEIFVTAADGEISKENAKAADYLALNYIKAAQEGKSITEAGGILSIG